MSIRSIWHIFYHSFWHIFLFLLTCLLTFFLVHLLHARQRWHANFQMLCKQSWLWKLRTPSFICQDARRQRIFVRSCWRCFVCNGWTTCEQRCEAHFRNSLSHLFAICFAVRDSFNSLKRVHAFQPNILGIGNQPWIKTYQTSFANLRLHDWARNLSHHVLSHMPTNRNLWETAGHPCVVLWWARYCDLRVLEYERRDIQVCKRHFPPPLKLPLSRHGTTLVFW